MEKARQIGAEEMTYRYEQDFSLLVDKYCGFGPPSKVADYLAEFVEAGANYFILAPIMPPDKRRAHLQRLAEEVMPLLDKVEPGRVI